MHKFVLFNHTLMPALDASISTLSSAALYGKGVFTTVAIHDGKPFLWEKHWRRLTSDAGKLNIDVSEFSESVTKDALDQVTQKNNVSDGRARVTFFDRSPSPIWPHETRQTTGLLITTGDLRPVTDSIRLTVSPYMVNSRSPLAGIKSCNYLEKLMALDAARSTGFDDALCINDRREITGATMANVFWLTNDRLYTPSLKTGCLAGTTREFVLENVECTEVETLLEELRSANAIFLTSAAIGVVQVAQFESIAFEKQTTRILDILPAMR